MEKLIKRIAHTINLHGNSPMYDSGYEAWSSDIPSLSRKFIEEDADKAYKKYIGEEAYNKRFGTLSFSEAWKEHLKFKDEAMRYYYDNILNKSLKDLLEKKKDVTPSLIAAGVSIPGSIMSLINLPIVKGIGIGLTIPDQIYDWAALVDTPKPSTAAHVGMDYAGNAFDLVTKATPIKWDDMIVKPIGYALSMAGNVDDFASASGHDIFSELDDKAYLKNGKWYDGSTILPEITITPSKKNGGGIHIKEENRGKFTKSAKAAGESVQEHAHKVVNNPNATPLQKKRAQFAINAKKWHH